MKRIIIADDSATARMFIKRCLEIIGLGDSEIFETEHERAGIPQSEIRRSGGCRNPGGLISTETGADIIQEANFYVPKRPSKNPSRRI
ncbi:hypothetical protein [Malonomonas rubra]|uniref:hypothetical protein n=1 Tax=Malonomonas rubra TaxID=57040 RepID=UPI0026EA4125|nr:hypothetical protein [Malonomonas rubra]